VSFMALQACRLVKPKNGMEVHERHDRIQRPDGFGSCIARAKGFALSHPASPEGALPFVEMRQDFRPREGKECQRACPRASGVAGCPLASSISTGCLGHLMSWGSPGSSASSSSIRKEED
jgi:hypothetical protein